MNKTTIRKAILEIKKEQDTSKIWGEFREALVVASQKYGELAEIAENKGIKGAMKQYYADVNEFLDAAKSLVLRLAKIEGEEKRNRFSHH